MAALGVLEELLELLGVYLVVLVVLYNFVLGHGVRLREGIACFALPFQVLYLAEVKLDVGKLFIDCDMADF